MSTVVVLDSTPVGLLRHPRDPPHAAACRRWLADLQGAGRRVILPEIIDYETRREFLRLSSRKALSNLELSGQRPAPDHALDSDAILAAQALSLGVPGVVATSNPAHLSRFVAAELWLNITP